MKKLISLALIIGAMGGLSVCHAHDAYIEAQGGFISNSYGVRWGRMGEHLDTSIGYLKSEVHDVDLHTMGAEWYFVTPFKAVLARIGGGVGFTIPNFPNGGEKGDNGVSWTVGAGAEYKLGESWSILGMMKGFFFKTDTQVTTYGSHAEVLSTGQGIEVIDVYHQDAPRQFNTLMIGLAIRYYF